MKNHRWFPGLALGLALLLGACAPPNQGTGESPSDATASPTVEASPSESPEAMESPGVMESPEASESPEATPDTYDY